jgi:hypothetical protein
MIALLAGKPNWKDELRATLTKQWMYHLHRVDADHSAIT